MKRWPLTLALLILPAASVQAHFLWIVPEGGNAKVIFSDNLQADDPALLEKVAHTKMFTRDAAGKETPLAWKKSDEGFLLDLSARPRVVGGVCVYGVLQRGDSKPFLLNYYPKLIVGREDAGKTWERLPVEILALTTGKQLEFQVIKQGKPIADAEVVVLAPGVKKGETFTSNKEGRVPLGAVPPGMYAVRARVIENRSGEHEGKKYDEVRHYATLVFDSSFSFAAPVEKKEKTTKPQAADAEATRLLADARAARASWTNFTGFTADIEVNLDGKLSRGKMLVDAKGNVGFDQLDKAAEQWAEPLLKSLVAHRTDGAAERDTPCAFADDQTDHPLGRAINVLNDELHSSYRIKDRQITVVNRQMKGSRFTITVLENRLNEEGKFLPAHYVVSYWNTQTGELQRSITNHQTWTRVGRLDLPATTTVLTASGKSDKADAGATARAIKITNHKLLEVAAR